MRHLQTARLDSRKILPSETFFGFMSAVKNTFENPCMIRCNRRFGSKQREDRDPTDKISIAGQQNQDNDYTLGRKTRTHFLTCKYLPNASIANPPNQAFHFR